MKKLLLICLLTFASTTHARNLNVMFLNDNPANCDFRSLHDARQMPDGSFASTFTLRFLGEGAAAQFINRLERFNQLGNFTVDQITLGTIKDPFNARLDQVDKFNKMNGRFGRKARNRFYENGVFNCVNDY